MASKKEKPRLPEHQVQLVNNFRARNYKQQQLIDMIESDEIIIATGPAGTGKTYVALATAFSLLGPVYKKVILAKSVTTLPGEEIGFLKGGIEDKMEPFVMSYMWNIEKICGPNSFNDLINKGLLQVLPLAYIRGLSIDNSIVIVDESQNIDSDMFKTIITRIGENSKYIFLGDTEQIDRKYKADSCLERVIDIFRNSSIIGTLEFFDEDCVRNPIIPKILSILRSNNI